MSGPEASRLARAFPWALTVVIGLWALALPFGSEPDAEGFDLDAVRRLPVSFQGRVKPLDSVARDSLMVLSARTHPEPVEREAIRPLPWLLEAMAEPHASAERRVFRIDHPDVIALLHQRQDRAEGGIRKLFAWEELKPHLREVREEARAASQADSRDRNAFERKVLELWSKIDRYRQITQLSGVHAVAPLEDPEGGTWRSLGRVLSESGAHAHAPEDASARAWLGILQAWRGGDPDAFAGEAARYGATLRERFPEVTDRAGVEVRFNRAEPFVNAAALYVGVFVLAALSWLGWRKPLEQGAFHLLLLALLIHSVGLVVRVYLMGRPPVTNLYSSAVFVGWGCVVASAVLEGLYKNGVGLVTAAAAGFASLLLATWGLTGDGDTMAVLQAVLDTNFWLATHVVVISLGYAATFLAGLLAFVYLVRGLFTRSLPRTEARSIASMIYGVICFATLFSFVGTILGGIWADMSWGRFWGWDPKENGALLIVLWNALILHARWGGVVRERGLVGLAILGNIVTSWSWFGTNMLGVGLHSYGFMDQAKAWLYAWVGFNLLAAGLTRIPLERWRSPLTKPAGRGPSAPSTP